MLFLTRPVEALLPMPIVLVAVALLALWLCRPPRPMRPSSDAVAVQARVARRRWRVAAVLFVAWAWLFSVPAIANLGIRMLEGEPSLPESRPVHADAHAWIVVPASGMPSVNGPGAVLDLAGYERLHGAIDLWRRGGGQVIFAGGLSDDPERSLAAVMRRHAIRAGLPAEQVHMVTGSATTREDLQGAVRIIRGSPTVAGAIRVVTSAAHMPRALAVVRREGVVAEPWPVDFRQIVAPGWRAWLPNNGGPQRFAGLLHEVVGLAVYRWRGWA